LLFSFQAQVQGPEETPYAGRYFQLKLVFSSDFPNSPPRGFFLTKIYHPNVDISTGAICVNTLKKDWSPTVTLSHVLGVIRCLLIIPFPESSLNDEAGKLFMESYEEYARRAKLMANIHGKQVSPRVNEDTTTANVAEIPSMKNSKENEGKLVNLQVKQSSSGAVLKQSNSAERNSNEVMGNVVKKQKPAKSAGGIEKKSKKKSSLRRL
jgi:Ubiquitin-protein ligase